MDSFIRTERAAPHLGVPVARTLLMVAVDIDDSVVYIDEHELAFSTDPSSDAFLPERVYPDPALRALFIAPCSNRTVETMEPAPITIPSARKENFSLKLVPITGNSPKRISPNVGNCDGAEPFGNPRQVQK
ncbi:hypothetical protein CQ018_07050 [Arthrobacter sp. MYb227]|uniref:hypothetical protein n=1 Tax=Arthrobacter sp. MYb227 TaxID=1848601 RepID=UPI000CFD5484|nr:hypothetical protein [Arthrobacter sp. MYb227]PQZ95077.1 hypothetical protein CQ018_07050 [Arthrobacter sp. MYb227]